MTLSIQTHKGKIMKRGLLSGTGPALQAQEKRRIDQRRPMKTPRMIYRKLILLWQAISHQSDFVLRKNRANNSSKI